MGYSVLKPGVPLLLPVYKLEEELPSLPMDDDCWFYRQGAAVTLLCRLMCHF